MGSDPEVSVPSRDEYVAASLGIPIEQVSRQTYSLDMTAGDQSVGYQWRVVWQGEPPSGVETHETGDEVWSYIVPFDWDQPRTQMCNQYTTRASSAEVAALFKAKMTDTNAGPGTVFPKGIGMVVRQSDGERIVDGMTWGFPMRMKGMKAESQPRPVNNARADKLDAYPWRFAFQERRCIIPVSEFAEAEGEKGAKTKVWFSLPEEPLFGVAGLWNNSDEWGRVYTMVMTEACQHVAEVHDRMPVILKRDDWQDWLDGAPDDARILCRPYPDLMVVNRTAERWNARSPA